MFLKIFTNIMQQVATNKSSLLTGDTKVKHTKITPIFTEN